MKKVLFLDFDGVLNNGKFLIKAMADFPNLLMPEKVELLNRIIEETDCDIVFSTSWRERFEMSKLEDIMEAVGFKYRDKCVGVTEEHLFEDRAYEIKKYVNDHNVERYIAVDDCVEELTNILEMTIITDPNYGLTENNVTEIINFLNKP